MGSIKVSQYGRVDFIEIHSTKVTDFNAPVLFQHNKERGREGQGKGCEEERKE